MTEYPTKGGVKGGHAVVVETQFSNNHVERPAHYNQGSALPEGMPKGLTNVGNTCYANAALQCLLSTALTNALLDPQVVPLFRRYSSNPNLLAKGSGSVDSEEDLNENPGHETLKKKTPESERLRRKEKEESKMHDNCQWLTRELTSITQEYTNGVEQVRPSSSYMGWLSASPARPNNVVNPGSITRHPDRLSQCLSPYQQEDAHEFLRALLSTLVMNGHNKQLSSLFDGLLESAVTCQTCGRASLTRDRYMDLSLDINNPDISTLDDALYEYTKTEVLDGDNLVFCPKCEKKRSVTKGLRLATAPSILVCHLKRFAFDKYGRLIRLHKKIKFDERLDIGEFMSGLNKARPPPYDLVGILVHQGATCASGHYLSFVKKNGEWYKCNDSVVTRVDQATVFEQQAYIMMYEVAEMRERTGCTPQAKMGKQMPHSFTDDDHAEMSKDGTSTHAHSSWRSRADSSGSTQHTQPPYQRLLRFLNETDGITNFLSDMCCDSTSNLREPNTHELTPNDRRRRERTDSSDAIDIRRSLSGEGLKGIETRQKKTNNGIRSQTAPRQRTQSYEFPISGFDMNMGSPRTTHSDSKGRERTRRPNKKTDGRNSGSNSLRDRPSPRPPGIHTMGGSNRDLPPLPRTGHKRAVSTASASHKRTVLNPSSRRKNSGGMMQAL
jgi:hypothetical protein